MSNHVAGTSCIITVIVVTIIIIIIIAIILAIDIVIDIVIFIAVTVCLSGGSWQPSTRPSSSPALSWFQNLCSVLHVLWRSVSTVARCGVHVRPWFSMSLMYQRAVSVAQLTVSSLFGAASQCCTCHGEVRGFHAVNLRVLCCVFGLLCWMSV